MASSNPLENHISCAICFEIYRNPHVLKDCYHTFCHECIKQLDIIGKITCPECRTVSCTKEIRKDFKLQGVIDAYNINAQQSSSPSTCSTKCGVCEKSHKPVKYYCNECAHYLCLDCGEGHKRIKACRDHTVRFLEAIFKSSEDKLKSLSHNFRQAISSIDRKLDDINIAMDNIREAELQQLNDLTKYTEDAITQLKESKKRLEILVKDANDNVVRNQQQHIGILQNNRKELQCNINFIDDLVSSQDPVILTETAPSVSEKMESVLKDLTDHLPEVSLSLKSPVCVKRVEQWDVTSSIEVTVDNIIYGGPDIQPCTESLYSYLRSYKYTELKSAILKFWPETVLEINNKIWCAGLNTIGIYNEGCKMERDIHYNVISSIRALVHTNGQIIVASGSGLHQLDITGVYRTKLSDGMFSGASVCNGWLFALEYKTMNIMVYKYSSKWEKVKVFKLHYNNGNHWDRICIKKTKMFVSSYNNKTIFVYNTQGELQDEVKLGTMLLCDVDGDGNMLVMDYGSGQVKVYNRHRHWSVIQMDGSTLCPMCVVMDKTGNIWLAKGGGGVQFELKKYAKSTKEYFI